jgi:hypothetical protein
MALACLGNPQGLLYMAFNQDNTCLALGTRDGLRIYSIDTHQVVYRKAIGALGCAPGRAVGRAARAGAAGMRRGPAYAARRCRTSWGPGPYVQRAGLRTGADGAPLPTPRPSPPRDRFTHRLTEMLFCTSLVAYVGAGEQPALTPRKLTIMNTSNGEPIQHMSFVSAPPQTGGMELWCGGALGPAVAPGRGGVEQGVVSSRRGR